MRQVLIVDDDLSIRETLRLALEDAGYAVAEASDGVVALDLLRAARAPMVVILDLMMPRLDGAGVLGVIAGDQRLARRHRFILTTASHHTMSLAFANLLTNLNVPVVHKPFDLDGLLAIVDTATTYLDAR